MNNHTKQNSSVHFSSVRLLNVRHSPDNVLPLFQDDSRVAFSSQCLLSHTQATGHILEASFLTFPVYSYSACCRANSSFASHAVTMILLMNHYLIHHFPYLKYLWGFLRRLLLYQHHHLLAKLL